MDLGNNCECRWRGKVRVFEHEGIDGVKISVFEGWVEIWCDGTFEGLNTQPLGML